MTSGSASRRQRGFTYVVAMFAVAIAGLLLAVTGEVWSQSRQREKERELLYAGERFRDAIGLYYQRTPGAVKRYPGKLEELLEDKRFLSLQRYLRKIYADPMTGEARWGTIAAPGGGINGVYSLSDRQPIKSGGFEARYPSFAGSSRYSDWRFVYEPPEGSVPDPSKAGTPGTADPAQTGRT